MDMPVVVPIPIPTKGLPWYKRALKAFKRRQWKLIEDYTLEIEHLGRRAMVPAPFDFDFASVPRIFWFVLDPVGLLLVGSVFHDCGYRYGGLLLESIYKKDQWSFIRFDKPEIDLIFEKITDQVNDMKIMARLARWAVNIGGYFTWNAARKENRDIFKDYPKLEQIYGYLEKTAPIKTP